jgi:hypothetical protein
VLTRESSVVDPHHFDADPEADSTYNPDADPDADQNSPKLVNEQKISK